MGIKMSLLGAVAVLLALTMLGGAEATVSGVQTVAGGGVADDGPATASNLFWPTSVASDTAGNVYIADPYAARVRIVDPSGHITTFAGTGVQGLSGDGGPATQAQLDLPYTVATDATGDVFIADAANNRIREVSPSGVISTVPGTASAGLAYPRGLDADNAGNLFIADTGNNRVLEVNISTGATTLIAGDGSSDCYPNGDGGDATFAHVCSPSGVAVTPAGEVYVSEAYGHRVRIVDSTGKINEALPPNANPRAYEPRQLAYDSADAKLYIADDGGSAILRFDPGSGTATLIVGTGETGNPACGFSGDGGSAAAAKLCTPQGVALGPAGKLYIADSDNRRIRRIDAGTIDTWAGDGNCCYSGDGRSALNAALNYPHDVALEPGGLLIADTRNDRVRRVAAGSITTIAGNGANDAFGFCLPYAGDGGPGVNATLCNPSGVATGSDGSVYIAAGLLLRLSPGGTITTVAGGGANDPGDGGPATNATLFASDVALDAGGNIFITDRGHDSVRKIDPAGTISTFYKNSSGFCCGDPWVLTLDGRDNVYLAQTGSVMKISPTGQAIKIAGNPGMPDQIDPCTHPGETIPTSKLGLGVPVGLAIDGGGNLYISAGGCVVEVDSSGSGQVVAGAGAEGFAGDGGPPLNASFFSPTGIAIGLGGELWIADSGNGRIRVLPGVVSAPVPQITINSGPNGPVRSTTASFAFDTSSPRAAFTCSLDAGPYSQCSSPTQLSGLTEGAHSLTIRAQDLVGNSGQTSRSWEIDTTPPETAIDSGPASPTSATTSSFSFSASEAGSSFQCKLDDAAFVACTSPKSYSGLSEGDHTFEVAATDSAGNTDATPGSRSWTVDITPPQTTIGSGPSNPTTATNATFEFRASEAGSTFQCAVDGAAFAACATPRPYTELGLGSHLFAVRAIDGAGNVDPTPASQAWKIVAISPAPFRCVVPKLTGKTLGAARRLLARAHCRLGRVRSTHSKTVPKGRIISQSPRPKMKRANGARIAVTLSSGRLRHE